MEELLLPSGEEEARSDHSSYAPGHAGRTMGDRVKTFLQVTVKEDLKRTVRNFLKKNGLLTLSVIAVLTGCTLGFMLRGTQLSTQVGTTHLTPTCHTLPALDQDSPAGFLTFQLPC
ncbi:excitatory amino acid transporter 5-like [Lates japonicus]|uniref:Excitatory amino acid transporter 5-like protein n=1 Tax=Lates japonicus TaxID=270547 RepID=A0AAD3NAP5_LATJO|nr:excitatory amino acid transporter 5-like protein [Lates japonicus]